MTDATTDQINEALARIRALADQIPGSSPFASLTIANEIQQYARLVQRLRAARRRLGSLSQAT